jgi:D-serine deaminase-like pyridoxal phosphate-dependent protein
MLDQGNASATSTSGAQADTAHPASAPAAQQEQPQRQMQAPHTPDYTYYKRVFAGRTMPFAYLDLDLLDENIRQVAARARGKRVRLASKSLRSVAVLRRILAADSCFQGIMCFTAREAVYLASLGFRDLLIGYPTWHADDIAAIAQATANGAEITLMLDSVAHVQQIETVASRYEVRLPVCLDIDMSLPLPGLHFGVWRSPLRTAAQARPVLDAIAAAPHVRLDGIMGYEAQIAGVGDHYPGKALKNTLVRALQRRSAREVARRRAEIVAQAQSMQPEGQPLRFVNGGGTGSIATTREETAVTEITVGSAFYGPALFDNYRSFRYRPAAGFAIEIVRQAAPAIYTCLGGGYVASGAAGADKLPQPYLPAGARLDSLEAAGEVQTPIKYSGSTQLHLGDPIFMRHSKAGELCERFTHLLLVQNGAVVDEVTTYRGDGQCFL